ncbi:NUDIX hydrolase [Bacillus sp. WLY-B-L8]|uniref:NUDIX hydrolase n=1 Tax=Bacillus multifaciens TaxID=3068506 RepID=UPI00274230FF|nr:NUDIX domain-containing protein [Bacillus sp. WLY-B-L8]MDP7977257.1 NUDIX domain-containing protein [Bacillus sp. WLY-B-L8]HDX9587502.1 NUDIX domain-containing protein [Bacillus pseudomycoides]
MYPRAKALGIIKHNDCILVEEYNGEHETGEGYYYRPLGGTIELGEYGAQTVIREFEEELGVTVKIDTYLGCLENIFQTGNTIGHELVQLYSAHFSNKELYKQNRFTITEGDNISYGVWVPTETFLQGEKTLYPNGLTELLSKK